MRRKETTEVCPAHTMKEVSGQLHVPVTFHLPPPRERTPITHRLGWASEPVWHFGQEKNLLPLVGIEALIIQP